MARGTILDRRMLHDRRMGASSIYAGPERRHLRDRRDERIAVCVFCEQICGDKKGWFKAPLLKENIADHLIDVCTVCAQNVLARTTV
jgi:hypothetical protein